MATRARTGRNGHPRGGAARIVARLRGAAAADGHGPDGNERLTGLAAAAIFILLAAEGLTILSLGTLLTPHMFIGVLLIPPILLKLGSIGYRFARYYTGDAAYRAAGPPATPLRILAPFLVLLTVLVFGSGVALMFTGDPHGSRLFTIHKLSFILWFIVAAIHILFYVARVLRLVGAESGRPPRSRGAAHRGLRAAALAGALIVGVGLAVAFIPAAHRWEHRNPAGQGDGRSGLVRTAALERVLPGPRRVA